MAVANNDGGSIQQRKQDRGWLLNAKYSDKRPLEEKWIKSLIRMCGNILADLPIELPDSSVVVQIFQCHLDHAVVAAVILAAPAQQRESQWEGLRRPAIAQGILVRQRTLITRPPALGLGAQVHTEPEFW